MTLPPLANLFAFSSPDRRLRGEVEADLIAARSFAEVWRPHPQWVVAEAPLPESPPTVEAARRAGLVFVEGRDRLISRARPEDDTAGLLDVLAAGPGRLATLPGDFGLVHFRDDGSAVVVRSCAGRVPLYVWADGAEVAIATLQRDLVAHLPGEIRIDPLSHATWMSCRGFTPDNRTFVAGATIVPSGHRAVVAPAAPVRPERYWDPRPERPVSSSARIVTDHAARLRELLVGNLALELDRGGRNLLSASGGVDSSAIGALAAGPAGRPINVAVSLVPRPGPKLEHEHSYITPLLDHLNVARRYEFGAYPGAIDGLQRDASPSFFPKFHPVLCVLDRVVNETGVLTYVGGEFCDDLFGAPVLHDWNVSAPPWQALARTGRDLHGRASLLRWCRDRAAGVLGWRLTDLPDRLPEPVNSELQAEYEQWRRGQRRYPTGAHRARRNLMERFPCGVSWLEMNWEISSSYGVRRVLPFVTRDMLELAAACHPQEVLADGPKTLLRRGLRDDVPHRNLYRPDKGAFLRGEPRPPRSSPTGFPSEAAAILDKSWLARSRSCERSVAWALLLLLRSLSEFGRQRSQRPGLSYSTEAT
ncbi:MAG: asparagine synthase-related protein [Actinomycetota bacterium]